MNRQTAVLVTGASRGIGREIALQLAQRGAMVYLAARKREAAASAAAELAAQGLTVTPLTLDVRDHSAIRELPRSLERLDVLVNNAGINLDGAQTACSLEAGVWRETFETNALAPLLLTQALLPLLRRGERSRIVNISSSMAATGNPMIGYPAYRMSKAALNSATMQLAAELAGAGIAVNAVCPGWVRTDLGGAQAPLSVEQGADTPVWAVLEAPQSLTGKFLHQRAVIPW